MPAYPYAHITLSVQISPSEELFLHFPQTLCRQMSTPLKKRANECLSEPTSI